MGRIRAFCADLASGCRTVCRCRLSSGDSMASQETRLRVNRTGRGRLVDRLHDQAAGVEGPTMGGGWPRTCPFLAAQQAPAAPLTLRTDFAWREHCYNPDKLVIDLRQNSGGDYTVGERWLIHPIRELASINRKGHLFVLVGAVTFSAAMNNAAQFRSQTAALLVGQTIGEKPNSYAEPRNMTLPNSHLTVRYSTR